MCCNFFFQKIIQFKFFYLALCPSLLKGALLKAYYDFFLVECRANGALIEQGMNGIHTLFCFGWIKVPPEIEVHVARAYGVYPFLWDRPPGAEQEDDETRFRKNSRARAYGA